MRLASHLGMPLRKCIQSHTHREFKTWMRYLKIQINVPDRSDYYLMRIAQRIQQVGSFNKKADKVKLEHQKIEFDLGDAKPPMSQSTKNDIISSAKARWRLAVGLIRGKKAPVKRRK